MLRRVKESFGLNVHVLTTLAFRGWSICAGAVTLFLLPMMLSATEQGYYYTFASVLALQIFFELGLNQIVMQFVSHEVAHLTRGVGGLLEGGVDYLDRLSSLVRVIRKWYFWAALLFFLSAGCAGLIFFDARGTLPRSEWIGIWIALTFSTAVNLFLSPSLAVMEGCGHVGQVAKMRLQQSAIGYAALWLGLTLHIGLWSAVAVPVTSAIYSTVWLRYQGKMIEGLRKRPRDGEEKLHWYREIFPLQWRIAISWVSGYFIFNLFTPMVFSRWGPAQAGKIGLALAMFTAVSTIGMSWVNATAPKFAMHISRDERHDLNILFLSVLKRSTAVTIFLCVGLVMAGWVCRAAGLPFMDRVASIDILACLASVTAVNSVIFSLAAYMRAHKEEPMLPVSVVTALLTIGALYVGSQVSLLIMMLCYLAVTALVTLPWTSRLFLTYFRRT